jgi:CRISPR-associated protein Cas5h
MIVLTFRIGGAMAHFRKVFSNSTSLTYYFPPRTTVMGIIAAAMGLKRDSYYEKLDKYQYSVAPLTGLRKIMFGENYLDTDEVSVTTLRGLKQRVPTAREFVVPSGEQSFLEYEVLVYPFDDTMEKSLKAPAYPISLGAANMLGYVDYVEKVECDEINVINGKVNSVVSLKPRIESNIKVAIEDMVPRTFDEGRHSGPLSTYFIELNAMPLHVEGEAKGVKCGERQYLFL